MNDKQRHASQLQAWINQKQTQGKAPEKPAQTIDSIAMKDRQNQMRLLWLRYQEALTDMGENPPSNEVELEAHLAAVRGAWMKWQTLVCQGIDPDPDTVI